MNSKQDRSLSYLRDISHPLQYESDLDPLVNALENKRFVLLGKATHGTAEFYQWRSAITKRIIENQSVSFIAVEGDWPDCYRINRYIKGYKNSGKNAEEVLKEFSRWPTWMWANAEMINLIEWLREWNKNFDDKNKIGFYGMDVYSLWESMQEVLAFLKKVDPKAVSHAKDMYECFEPYGGDPDRYALSTMYVPQGCEEEAVRVLRKMHKEIHKYPEDPEEKFNALQNAFVATRAEQYYRSMLQGDASSWNNRDRSMVDTLYRLNDFYGAAQTAIVWAHNTHVGDARFTNMPQEGMFNIGQVLREEIGEDFVFSLGLLTYKGTVFAGNRWDRPMRIMQIPPAKEGSWDKVFHDVGGDNRLFIFPKKTADNPLTTWRKQRAIGVVYNPSYERGNYVPTMIGGRYDGIIYIDTSHMLHPLHMSHKPQLEVPETYPSAL